VQRLVRQQWLEHAAMPSGQRAYRASISQYRDKALWPPHSQTEDLQFSRNPARKSAEKSADLTYQLAFHYRHRHSLRDTDRQKGSKTKTRTKHPGNATNAGNGSTRLV